MVDDNRSAADALARVLRKSGDVVDVLYDGASAIERIRQDAPDLLLTDLKMEPVDGLQVLQAARHVEPPIEVVVFTAYGAVDVAVKAMRLGARDFLTKPVTVEQVLQRVEAVRTQRALRDEPPSIVENDELPHEIIQSAPPQFIAESEQGRALLDALQKAATVPSPVWIEGEIGSGREHAARMLHHLGKTPEAPFVTWDPTRDNPLPQRGTVLVAGVDDLSDDAQRRLLRQLHAAPRTLRIVATAQPDARRLVAEGRLRQELFYLLAVIVVTVPPLRSRREDILPLFRRAMAEYAERYGRAAPQLDQETLEILEGHAWPGNVRELNNLAERAVVMGSGALDMEFVQTPSEGLPKLEPGFDLGAWLDSQERRVLVEALRVAAGDRNRAGRLLGVERNTLRYKLNKYGLL